MTETYPWSFLTTAHFQALPIPSIQHQLHLTMNFLYFVILILAIIECVTASESSMTEIGQAIDNRNLVEVQRLCGKDKSLWEQASDHVVDTENVDFIANFLKIGVLVTGYALLTLCRKSSIVNSIRHKTI